MSATVEVLGLGNSLVDLLAYADDNYLSAQEMLKGAMNLIDEDRAEALYAARVDPRVISGGSAANTIVGVASFGVSAAYIGKVKQDPLGATFADDIRSTGVAFSTSPAEQGPSTGRCFIYVTPDGERTMNTYLGASSYLAPVDVDEALVKSAKVVYLEGYMWDRPAAKAAFQKAGEIARAANRRVALTLSDSFCVDRFRGEFIELMRSRTVDTIFANTDESPVAVPDAGISTRRSTVCARRACLASSPARKRAASSSMVIRLGRFPPSQSPSWSTRQAQATCSLRASSLGSPGGETWSLAGGLACSLRQRSFSISARGPVSRWRGWPKRTTSRFKSPRRWSKPVGR